ncbi:Blo t profilin allergen-like protein [Leptotrombidium deliense]|uniref:Profilin n=1 Tax=Leptotrombidium deliense TaxID=299467 RepID=A0A443SVM7_9ACAR|nr:Blo t profilin allergen-like protein [Leptotrombidium deliense]
MSWQAYVDNQICAQVSCRLAVIAGLDGAVWAKFEKDIPASVSVAMTTCVDRIGAASPWLDYILRIINTIFAMRAVLESAERMRSVTTEELKSISDAVRSDPTTFQSTGVRLGGEKYVCISSENNLVRGRKGSSALIIVATNTCLIVVATTDGFPPGQLNNVVEKLAEYLRANNY